MNFLGSTDQHRFRAEKERGREPARREQSFLDSSSQRSLATLGSDGSDARPSRVSAGKSVVRNARETLSGSRRSERVCADRSRLAFRRKRRISQCLARRPQSTRLVTRTKESNTCASIMARKIMMRNESERGRGKLPLPPSD